MIHGKIIKVCGMREAENIRDIESIQNIDMMGFIFYPKSSRFVSEIPSYLPVHTRRVGVFVNENEQMVLSNVARFCLNEVQLHGNESPEYCQSLQNAGLKIIKAFSIACPEDLHRIAEYEKNCELFLFDTKSEGYGGSGKTFDWNILHAYKGKTPFLLSGGINADSAKKLNEFNHPRLQGYDLNSHFEQAPALKDPERIRLFLNELESSIKIFSHHEQN